jgi:hypothetical protein
MGKKIREIRTKMRKTEQIKEENSTKTKKNKSVKIKQKKVEKRT